jgi:replicative DNA helicase
VGGAPYLHTLISSVPTAANAGYYARIVAERAILRRLVTAGTRIVQMGYGGDGNEIDDIVDRAQAEVYDVTERRTSDDYQPLDKILPATLDELEAISSRGGTMVGVPTGFRDLDDLTNGLHPGQFIVIAGRPALGKSTVGLDICRSASIKNNLTSCIFSLEMSRNEITMRLLSAESKIPLHHMRNGSMSDEDWAKLARRMGEVAEAPLFIDDSPNLSMMEIRAKARRLKQRHDLKLVVVDYLQLMTSAKRVESRQVEVSELSRSLKLLAKEIEVPVIAISQLNRGPEQRTDKRPMLSDLRECLTGDTVVTRCDTGERTPIRDLVGQRDVPVWSLDENLRRRPAVMREVWSTGVRPVTRLRLASGRTITATANHPLLTLNGWKPVGHFTVGDHLAITRATPAPEFASDPNVDVIPAEAWDFVRKAMKEHGVTTRGLAAALGTPYSGSTLYRCGLSRDRMARVATAVPDPHLKALAESDVSWDRVVGIDPAGEEEVFDAVVPGTHCFLANDVISHNSGAIEQDADMVVLLHREDFYEKESPRAGEADFIVAKNRNGPTRTVTVAFQGHYSRFVDMSPA